MNDLLKKIISNHHLSIDEARSCARYLLNEKGNPFLQSALLTALTIKEGSDDEVTGFALEILSHTHPIDLEPLDTPIVDLCGTGGDSLRTLNISTLCSIVVASTGLVSVAKHGNRSISGLFGSADVLESLGICINLPFDEATQCLREIGITFLFAPLCHPVMKHVGLIRKSLGIRTLFNVLGPLLNPYPIDSQTMGIYSASLLRTAVHVGHQLNRHICALHSDDGMDEISPEKPTTLLFQRTGDSQPQQFIFDPHNFGFSYQPLSDLVVNSKQDAQTLFLKVLNNDPVAPAISHSILFNSALSLWFTLDCSWEYAFECCQNALNNGLAFDLFCRWKKFSSSYLS